MKGGTSMDISIVLYLSTKRVSELLKKHIEVYSSFLMLMLGTVLILCGTLQLSNAQRDPERLPAQDPEGVCCVGMPEQTLLVLPPEPVFAVLGPEQLNMVDPETLAIDTGQIQAIDPLDPEALEANYDDSLNRYAAGNLLWFIEGSFGALLMIGAGLGAIVAGAFGAYKAAISLLFVAVGAFILRALVSLFFGTNYDAYTEGGMEFVGGGL